MATAKAQVLTSFYINQFYTGTSFWMYAVRHKWHIVVLISVIIGYRIICFIILSLSISHFTTDGLSEELTLIR